MSCGIYKITNQINNKVYIGKAGNIEHRWYEHRSDAKNPNKTYHLYQAMRKYGLDNFIFEIIEECPPDNEILSLREKYWINYYNSYHNGYNETLGGEGKLLYNPQEIYSLWDQGLSVLEITEQLHCEKQVVYDNLQNYSTYSTEESIRRAAPHRNQLISEATSKRLSYPVYQYDLEGNFIAEYPTISDAAKAFGYNRDHSIIKVINDSTRQLAYGYQWSKEKLDKMPVYKSRNKLAVRNINTGKIFPSIRSAAEWAGINKEGIRRVINGTRKSAGKIKDTNEPLYWEKLK